LSLLMTRGKDPHNRYSQSYNSMAACVGARWESLFRTGIGKRGARRGIGGINRQSDFLKVPSYSSALSPSPFNQAHLFFASVLISIPSHYIVRHSKLAADPLVLSDATTTCPSIYIPLYRLI
jgi:hypothetical protein